MECSGKRQRDAALDLFIPPTLRFVGFFPVDLKLRNDGATLLFAERGGG